MYTTCSIVISVEQKSLWCGIKTSYLRSLGKGVGLPKQEFVNALTFERLILPTASTSWRLVSWTDRRRHERLRLSLCRGRRLRHHERSSRGGKGLNTKRTTPKGSSPGRTHTFEVVASDSISDFEAVWNSRFRPGIQTHNFETSKELIRIENETGIVLRCNH